MRRREVLAMIGTASAAVAAGCSDDSSGADDGTAERRPATAVEVTTATPVPRPSPANIDGWLSELRYLEPVSVGAYVDDRAAGVRGAVENTADRRLRDVRVEVSFYDGRTRVGDGLDGPVDLDPGDEWRFDVPSPGDRRWDTYVGITGHGG